MRNDYELRILINVYPGFFFQLPTVSWKVFGTMNWMIE